MQSFSAKDIFKIVEVPKPFPMNIKFVLKDVQSNFDFSKPNVYSILFDGNPIYVGYSFNDKQKDVRKSRWTKQLETILFRGYRVGLNSKSFKEFKKSLNLKIDQQHHSEINIKKTDVMTSVNRIIFATKNWDEFKTLSSTNDSLLYRIKFQIEDSSGLDSKGDFKQQTKLLIKKLNTSCNG